MQAKPPAGEGDRPPLVARGGASHLPELDGVRGIALLLVFTFHYVGATGATGAVSGHLGALAAVVRSGWAGVDLFFVLSGFLITRILIAARGSREGGAPHYFANFYVRRALRIFPLYYLVLAILFVLLPRLAPVSADLAHVGHAQGWLWSYTANVGMARMGDDAFWSGRIWAGHFWTLSVEEQFYLVWPLVVWLLPPRRLFAVCVGLVAVVAAARVAAVWAGVPVVTIYVLTPFRADTLAAGAAIAALFATHAQAIPVGRTVKCLGAIAGVSALLLAAVAARQHGLEHLDRAVQLYGYTPLALLFASLIGLMLLSPKSAAPSRVMRWRWLRLVGKYSYAIYVFHFPLVPWFQAYLSTSMVAAKTGLPYAAAGPARFAIACAANLLLAFLSWHLFEKHFIQLKRFFPSRG